MFKFSRFLLIIITLFGLSFLFENSQNTNMISKTVTNPPSLLVKEQIEDKAENILGGIIPFSFKDESSNTINISAGSKVKATVTKCVDGDTLKLQVGSKKPTLRILNIDTPEKYGDKAKNGPMPFAVEASSYCNQLLEGKKVDIQVSNKEDPFDQYGRLLGSVLINEELYQSLIVSKGYALVKYVYPPDEELAKKYLYAQQKKARSLDKGIWKLDGYIQNGDYNYNFK